MWLDGLILLLIGALAWSGSRRGATVAGIQLVGLPLAYAGALAAAWAFGPALAEELELSELAGGVAAGTLGLLLVQAFVLLATRAARVPADELEPTSQALGALCGALRGALFALPILWLAGLAEGARVSGVRPELPDLSGAQLPALGSGVLGAGAKVVIDDREPGGRLAVRFVSRPAETLEGLQHVVSDARFVRLQRDAGFWQEVEQGSVNAALARPAARELVNDRRFRTRLAELGVVTAEAAGNARLFEAELSLALAQVGPRLRAVRNDPALAELLADPEVRASLQSGNTLALLRDPRFRALVSRAAQ
jgi:hypothetical protein